MTVPELGAEEVLAALTAAVPQASGVVEFGQASVEVPAAAWVPALRLARDELGADFFDWLTAVDELDEGFSVVAHLWSMRARAHVLLRTRVPREAATLASATEVFAGAAWHERETFEMFGITFTGFSEVTGLGLRPLLLPDGFSGHPLRKDFVLAARVAKPWPGAKEPGESDADTVGHPRRRTLPPGVPEPEVWGPHPIGAPAGPEEAP